MLYIINNLPPSSQNENRMYRITPIYIIEKDKVNMHHINYDFSAQKLQLTINLSQTSPIKNYSCK